MPVEFTRNDACIDIHEHVVCGLVKLVMAYDGSGRRISKTRMRDYGNGVWDTVLVTHYTGIGTEIRENLATSEPGTKVVVNMPQGLGRYGIEDADHTAENGSAQTFEWYLKNHLGSTMLVYGTQASSSTGGVKAAYDYRSFGEQIELTPPSTGKVTENFTGKERDDETQLDYFGARYLDPMLGMWTSVDPARQFASPYLYAGNGVNPVNVVDPNGNYTLNLNEDNTVASLVEDDNSNTVSLLDANGKLVNTFAAPPSGSYFFTEKLVGEKFDPNMQQNANAMIKDASQYWPADFIGWGTNGPFDFKNQYYFGADKTVGVLDGTIMTARDAGNAIWGGWTRHAYLCRATLGCDDLLPRIQAHLIMQGISKLVAPGFKEDPPSATMQSWGFNNYLPSTK